MTFWEIAFCVAIVVIIFLLILNNQPDPDRRKSTCASARDESEADRYAQMHSDYGSALLNRNATNRYNQMSSNLDGYSDYNSVAQFVGLEPEVFESHANYTTDMNRLVLGPSNMSERSDPNDPIPWLARPPSYDVYADENARTEHSEIPDQMRVRSRFLF
jgi:hypothetical protein